MGAVLTMSRQTCRVLIRDATSSDWPRIWPFLHQIVAAGDTFAYNPKLG
jgi:hypothetical protein